MRVYPMGIPEKMSALQRTIYCLVFCLSATNALAQAPETVRAFLENHCLICHNEKSQKGKLRLDNLPYDFKEAENSSKWKLALERISEGSMPPSGKKRPSAPEIESFEKVVQGPLNAALIAKAKKEGRTTLRRLNRIEYENTLHDLLGIRAKLKDLLPADALEHGFDNQSESLSISQVQIQRYLEAAEVALSSTICRTARPETKKESFGFQHQRTEQFIGKHWLKKDDGSIVFFTNNTYPPTHLYAFNAWNDGLYRVRIHGYSYQTQKPVPFGVYFGHYFKFGDMQLHSYQELPTDKPGVVELMVPLVKGDGMQILPSDLKGFNAYKQKDPDDPKTYKGAGLAILSVEVEGPVISEWPSKGHNLLFGNLEQKPRDKNPNRRNPVILQVQSNNPEEDAQRQLSNFLNKAFRRPVSKELVDVYLKLFKEQYSGGANFEEAMLTAAGAALCSPEFLFFQEKPGRLETHAVANRLSYFLWRSLPDEELIALAQKGNLTEPKVLLAQVDRMLADPRAKRFITDFTDAWLDLRNIDFTTPDKALYPEFDNELQESMLLETRGFFEEVLSKNLAIRNFIASDFAMLNARLANHYQIPDVEGVAIRKVKLPQNSIRGGLLSQSSVLKVSANGTNTSPVVRGVYVLDRFLGTKPPPPPPGVPAVEPDIRGAKTVRELLEKHRSVETCTGCHRMIDPPGFALEEFDVIGGTRSAFRVLGNPPGSKPIPGVRYRFGPNVDSTGELLDGRKFQDFQGFRQLLLADQDRFARCLILKLLAFATGREPGMENSRELEALVRKSSAKDHGFRDMIQLIVQSELFLEK